MARQNHQSASSRSKAKPQSPILSLSPGEVRNTTDPGDETQRRFRYQHAYGVILLVASIRKNLPYIAVWCEHHEDLLGELADGCYDAYQIKTKENGAWTLTDEPLKESIRRFVGLDQQFPGRIHEFYFVSNAGYEKSSARNKIARSPIHFLEALRDAATPADLVLPFDESFESLRAFCACDAESLFAVLKKLKLVKGPGLESFEAEITQDHLRHLSACTSWPAASLASLCQELIARVYRASALGVDDPSRHWVCLFAENHPDLNAKRISIESIVSHISKNSAHFLSMVQVKRHLSEFLEETLQLFLIDS